MTLDARSILAPDGPVARALPGYEARDEQLAMAEAVEAAFADHEHLIVEAGTGVGKSFAYLGPAILEAHANRRRVVISTCTIALQEQLIEKDLPLLAEALASEGIEFAAVLGKGRGNYLCLRRLQALLKSAEKVLATDRQIDQLDEIAAWALQTRTGELQEIEFPVDRGVWAKVAAEAGLCGGQKCPNHAKCFLKAARRKLQAANVVVCNHAFVFSDLPLPASAQLIGPYDLMVLDEAHTVEHVASEHFGRAVNNTNIATLLRDLYNEQNDRGLLALMGARDAIRTVQAAAAATEDFFGELADLARPAVADNGRVLQPEPVPDALTPALRALAGQLKDLRAECTNEDQRLELLAAEMRTAELAGDLAGLVQQDDENHVYWRSLRQLRRKGRLPGMTDERIVGLASAPILVAPILKQLLFDEKASVVMTSATLATSRGGGLDFEYLRSRLGCDDGRELLLTSPFDYRKQATLHVETRLGEPNRTAEFAPACAEAIAYYVEKSQGRCFVLATSYAMLNALAEELEDFCGRGGYHLLVQGRDLQRSQMLRRFREQPRSVLIGTMSFWQGVDVAGEALGNVIITKLPFAVPDEPIIEARIDAIRREGGNPFGEFQLPQAVILFKQGFGRLIRSREDRGFVVVLDHRIATKSYGRAFLDALPEIEIVYDEFAQEGQTHAG